MDGALLLCDRVNLIAISATANVTWKSLNSTHLDVRVQTYLVSFPNQE